MSKELSDDSQDSYTMSMNMKMIDEVHISQEGDDDVNDDFKPDLRFLNLAAG